MIFRPTIVKYAVGYNNLDSFTPGVRGFSGAR
jgi:hypothetical protein